MRSTLMSKHGNIDMQSVDFQSPMFFNELTMCFAELKKLKQNEIAESELVPNLSAIVKHHTGLNLAFSIDQYNPCVEIPKVDRNNILINSINRNYISSVDGLAMVNSAKDVVKGTVNLKTGRVTGIFEEIKVTIHLPFYMFLTKTYEPEEIAAITLHEVGHIFTYCEFITRTVSTNQALAGLSKALDNSGTVEERVVVLSSVKKALNLKELDEKELAKSNNKKIVEIVVITNIIKETESELGSNVYDFSTWEYLADQYATRYGAGRYLITSLDKMFKGSFNISFRSLAVYLAFEAFKLLSVMLNPVLPLMFGVFDSEGDGTYDKPEARFLRVRNQIVENLKIKDLPTERIENLKEDLVKVDEILKHVTDRRQFFGVLIDTFSPTARRRYNQKKLQQELEAIAVNDLFVKAAELKQLG